MKTVSKKSNKIFSSTQMKSVQKKKRSNLVAISMNQYGVKTIVNTQLETLEETIKDFDSGNDAEYFGGKGRKALYEYLLNWLRFEDAYFDSHTWKAVRGNKRWENFMDDCVIFAALDAVLLKRPIHLVHPDQYKKLLSKALWDATDGDLIELVEGIPIASKEMTLHLNTTHSGD